MHIESNKFNQPSFGYPIHGFIGTTNQIKGWEKNWISCFINLRIEPQLAILEKDFEKRMIIYNFYHILNHANMFGGSYYNEVQRYIKNILSM